jgi:hypothetical protein
MTEPDLNALRDAARRRRSGQPGFSGGERSWPSTVSSEARTQQPLPRQPSTPTVQNAVATPQGGGGLVVFGLVGLLVVGAIIAVAFSHTDSQSPGPSPPIVVSPSPPLSRPPSPQPPTPPPAPTFEDGEAALRFAGANVSNPQGINYALKALNIFSSLPVTPLTKDRIGRAHGMIGALSPNGPDACNHLKTARAIFVELGNGTEIQRTALALQVGGCVSAPLAAPLAAPPVAPPGRFVCHVPGGNSYWTCAIGQQCYGDHQCVGFGPIGVPRQIGR